MILEAEVEGKGLFRADHQCGSLFPESGLLTKKLAFLHTGRLRPVPILISRAARNPATTEETVRQMVEQRRVVRTERAYCHLPDLWQTIDDEFALRRYLCRGRGVAYRRRALFGVSASAQKAERCFWI